MHIATKIGRLIRYDNPLVVSPPGIPERREGMPIIVASLMRSGTHLMIDSLLNNCELLRRKPLYIDLDQHLLRYGLEASYHQILTAGYYVVKTHYPQLGSNNPEYRNTIIQLAEQASVIRINRSLEDISRSYRNFTQEEDIPPDFATMYRQFNEFWESHSDIAIDFSDLAGNWEKTMEKVWERLELTPDRHLCRPPQRNQRYTVYVHKLLTRLFGRNAPCINTTIGFALPSGAKRHK